MAHHAFRNAPQRVVGERFGAVEDRAGWQRPVDALGSGAPRFKPVGNVPVMRGSGPHHGTTIAACNHIQPPADRGCAIVGSDQFAVLDVVAQFFELAFPAPEDHSFASRARTPIRKQRPQSANSSTFSNWITRGRTAAAQRIATQARPRSFFERGLPPLALEW